MLPVVLATILILFIQSGIALIENQPLPLDEDDQLPLHDVAATPKDMFLPTNVKPAHYDLTLEPFFNNYTFRGHVEIKINVKLTTDSIVIHADGLNITASSIRASSNIEQPASWTHDKESQTVTFKMSQPLASGANATIVIDFLGHVRDDLSGLFASHFTRPDGSQGDIIMTHMEPTYARRAFPCFDEPALKATFTVSLVADASLASISNMNVDRIEDINSVEGHKSITRFHTTPPMSTYLMACAVGELSYIENTDTRIPIRIYASPADDPELSRYVAHIVARGLIFFENLLDLKYPLPKLDLLAAPVFLQGGMENWGIIIAHSTFFSYNATVDSTDKKDLIARLFLHELAHQWFGNIVTLQWWDQTWLNEGGANDATSYCMQNLEPNWALSEHSILGGVSGAFGVDAYRGSHPVEIPISEPDHIFQAFDQISYSKGAIVLKMIREYLTTDVFYAGMSRYFLAHAYGNVVTADLWKALSDSSGVDVSAIMDPWTKTVGYPLVRVSETDDGALEFEQHRFFLTGEPSPEEDTTLWPVFLSMRSSTERDNTILMNRTGSVARPQQDDFYILNSNYTYLYRTQYPLDRLRKLAEAARSGLLTIQERAGLISDTCALAHAGYQKTSSCIGLILSLHEQDSLPWTEIIEQIRSIMSAWHDDAEIHDALQALYRHMTGRLSHHLGWNFSSGNNHTMKQFKAMMFVEAGLAGDEQVLGAAGDMFERFAAGNEEAIDHNIQRGVFAMALLHGDSREYNTILHYANTVRSSYNRRMALQSLLVTETASLVQRTLDAIIAQDFDPSDVTLILSGAGSSLTARNMLWDWTRDNWSQLKRLLPDALGVREQLAKAATRHLTSPKQLQELRQLVGKEDIRGFESELKLSIEQVRGVVAWVERDTDDLRDLLGLDVNEEL